MARRYYANAAPQLTLAGSITSGATSLSISGSFAGWPTNFPYYACLDKGTASAEIVSVTNVVGTTATIVRAQDGTAAISHPAGATLDQVFVRQDMDEANAHVNANTGVHGVSGSVVGTSDVQTLSNKTLSSPVWSGTATGSGAVNTSGAITTSAALSAGSAAISGAATAASFTANGDGKVTGVVVFKSYANEAAATSALPSPATGTTVYLTAPTTAGFSAGLHRWNGSAWVPLSQRGSLLGSATAGANVTLSTTSAFASTTAVTFTLVEQRRVRIVAQAIYVMASGASGRFVTRAAYNSGASPVIGSAVTPGQGAAAVTTVTGGSGAPSASAEGDVLLAAGTYTAYASVQRNAGGSATDTAGTFYVAVYDAGPI